MGVKGLYCTLFIVIFLFLGEFIVEQNTAFPVYEGLKRNAIDVVYCSHFLLDSFIKKDL